MISFPNLGKLGRLGNQLFQIASTIGEAKRNQHLYCFPEWEYQDFFANKLPTAKLLIKDIGSEKACNYQPFTLPKLARPIGVNGYFQSEKYFKHCEDQIRNQFRFSSEIESYIRQKYEDEIRTCTASIHVRRGDYKSLSQVYYLQDMDYYSECLSLCKANKFAIFTDDPEWCEENFKTFNYVLINERGHKNDLSTPESEEESKGFLREDLIEFALMTKFPNSIIANSSFSWWAAWLNNSTDGKVFAPKKWYKEEHVNKIYETKENYDYRDDLIPESWTLV